MDSAQPRPHLVRTRSLHPQPLNNDFHGTPCIRFQHPGNYSARLRVSQPATSNYSGIKPCAGRVQGVHGSPQRWPAAIPGAVLHFLPPFDNGTVVSAWPKAFVSCSPVRTLAIEFVWDLFLPSKATDPRCGVACAQLRRSQRDLLFDRSARDQRGLLTITSTTGFSAVLASAVSRWSVLRMGKGTH